MPPYTWRQPEFPGDGSDHKWLDPTLLVICQNADMESAIEPLLNSLKQPFAPRRVACIFVHETMRDAFCELMRSSMEIMHHQAASHSHYLRTVAMVKCLQAETVCLLTPDDINFRSKMTPGSPMIVCEFNQNFFGGGKPTSVVTMHTFRNASELPSLLINEQVPFVSAAIWGRKMASVYEAALQLDMTVVYINCHNVPLVPIREYFEFKQPHVVMAQYHHFEVIFHEGKYRMIVYPAKVFWEPSDGKVATDAEEEPPSEGKNKKPGHNKK
ncbi:uncharacterized protein LOC110183659 [Drosophila serrata]|uniref:uncharacterized protein LOC110183659 n=1 Tax=Drosophila serrata TaxID=7274 RepID=UPI000A1D281D|nr:uncharacterized protein LOC110183659 [Drosophila serrata]